MAVDIVINETIDSVDITVNPNIIQVNVTRTSGGGGGIESVTGTTVDNTDPLNPIVGVPNLTQVLTQGDISYIFAPITDSVFTIPLGWELTENYIESQDYSVGGGLFLDNSIIFPQDCTIRLQHGYVRDDESTVTLLAFPFTTDSIVYYQGAPITNITINPEDYCILKFIGRSADINYWILTVTNKSSGGGGGTWGSITGTLSAQTDLQTALNGKVDENAAITGATKTKVTYDAKGLVTAGADAEVADITGLQTALDAKVDETDWVDYTSLSTIVGWSSFTANKFIWYKIIDGIMFVNFYLEGTSNAANATFTLPNSNTIASFSLSAYVVNNGAVTTNQVGRIFVPNGSETVTVNRDNTGLAYTQSGTKTIAGQFFIKI